MMDLSSLAVTPSIRFGVDQARTSVGVGVLPIERKAQFVAQMLTVEKSFLPQSVALRLFASSLGAHAKLRHFSVHAVVAHAVISVHAGVVHAVITTATAQKIE